MHIRFLRSLAGTVTLAAILLASGCMQTRAPSAVGAHAAPKYKADVPESVETPDTVSTHLLGTLHFFDGMPDAETVRRPTTSSTSRARQRRS